MGVSPSLMVCHWDVHFLLLCLRLWHFKHASANAVTPSHYLTVALCHGAEWGGRWTQPPPKSKSLPLFLEVQKIFTEKSFTFCFMILVNFTLFKWLISLKRKIILHHLPFHFGERICWDLYSPFWKSYHLHFFALFFWFSFLHFFLPFFRGERGYLNLFSILNVLFNISVYLFLWLFLWLQ